MDVTCRLADPEAEAQFRCSYEHLYHRICRLADNVAGLFLCGDAHILIAPNAPRAGAPRFIAVTFDEDAAAKYELEVKKLIARKRFPKELPKPDFCVTLYVQFSDGGQEQFSFDFATYSEETLEAFCQAICESAKRRYRLRFSAAKRLF